MINENKPNWKYKMNLKEVKDAMENHNWIMTFILLRNEINRIIKVIKETDPRDIDLAEELERWTEDMWFNDADEINGFGIIKNDDDWEELEFELNSLYDIADYNKMIWID